MMTSEGELLFSAGDKIQNQIFTKYAQGALCSREANRWVISLSRVTRQLRYLCDRTYDENIKRQCVTENLYFLKRIKQEKDKFDEEKSS